MPNGDWLATRLSAVKQVGGRSVFEEREHGDDPAMDRRSRQAQLCEDRVDVLLYRRLGKKQGLLYACIGLSLSHLSKDVQLPPSQGAERARCARLLASDEGVDDQRIDDRSAGRHLLERAHEVLEITDPILEQVRQTRRAVMEKRSGVALISVLRQHHDADLGVR